MYNRLRNLTSLWKTWYVIQCVAMYTLLLYHTVREYRQFKSKAFNPRYGSQWSETPLNICVAILVFVCALIPVHIYACLMRVGNVVNDGDSLMHKAGIVLKTHLDQMYEFSSFKLIGQRLLRHLRPCVYLIHVITAMALLLPTPLLQAEQIKNEALSREHIWMSEIVSLITGAIGPTEGINNIENGENGPPSSSPYRVQQATISLHTVNYIYGAFLLCIQYPTVFWSSNHYFANIYSTFSIFSLAQILLEFHTFSLYHKLFINNAMDGGFVVISSWGCLVLLLCAVFVLLFMLVVMFEYGYLHALLSLSRHRQYFLTDKSSKVFVEETIVKTSSQCLSKHWPSIFGLLTLLILMSLKIPALGQYVMCYRSTGHSLFLVNVLITFLFLGICLVIWFAFCVKREWNFTLKFALMQHQNSLLSQSEMVGGGGSSVGLTSHSNTRQMMTSPSIDASVYNYYNEQMSGGGVGGVGGLDGSGNMPLLMNQSNNLADAIIAGRQSVLGHSANSTIDRYINVGNGYPLSMLPSTIDEHIGVPEDSPSVSSSRPREHGSNQSSSSQAETSLMGLNVGATSLFPFNNQRMGVIGGEMEPNYATISSLVNGSTNQHYAGVLGNQQNTNKFRRFNGFKSPIPNQDIMMNQYPNSPIMNIPGNNNNMMTNSGHYEDYQMGTNYPDPNLSSFTNSVPQQLRSMAPSSSPGGTVPDILQGNDIMMGGGTTTPGDPTSNLMSWPGIRTATYGGVGGGVGSGVAVAQQMKNHYAGSQDLTVDITDDDLLDAGRSVEDSHIDENGESKLCSEV